MTKIKKLIAYLDIWIDAAARMFGWLLGVLAALFVLNALIIWLHWMN